MKRIRKAASSTPLPAVRAIPPRIPSLYERPLVRRAVVLVAGAVAVAGLVNGAMQIVHAIKRGTLPETTFALAGLAVLAAVAAYLAGRAEGDVSHGTTSDRQRAKGRLALGSRSARKEDEAARAAAVSVDAAGDDSAVRGSSALKTKFLDDISQELRAPITSICLAARIIRKHFDSTPEVVTHFGDTLLAEADRLGQTVDEFMELARLESGVTEWREAEVDAADLIQRAVADIETIAVSYGVSVGFTLEPELPPLHVDLDRVTQALTIMLASAVRSASEGSEIVIQIAGAHGGWVFTVGAPSFVYPHAEARKIQVRADDGGAGDELPRQAVGRGLGLCLCREIVTHYHGRLWVEGNQGAPNCVRFTLPYRQNRRSATASVAATSAKQSPLSRLENKPAPAPTPPQDAAADLEQRRELAVKAQLERAAVQSQGASPAVPEPAKPVSADATKSAARPESKSAAATQTEEPTKPSASASKTTSDEEVRAAEPTATPAPAATTEPVAQARSATPLADRTAAHATAAKAASDDATPSRPAREASPSVAATPVVHRESTSTLDTRSDSRDEGVDDDAALEVEIEDSPVHAPVSGTMIAAHHRTVGPPVLAHASVPAIRTTQSAASAAMQGSDELLLEIAQAQTSEGNQLVVSAEVRSLLESAPGTLPAVAGQTMPAASGARGAYTPSKRRMVAAPWVVRTGADAAASEPPPAEPVDPQAAAAQRARLNERLAKRLGIKRDGDGTSGGAAGGRPRSRRLG